MERHFLDGSKHIKFADGSSKLMRLDGYEETTLPDGTKMKVHNGLSLLFDNLFKTVWLKTLVKYRCIVNF